MGVQITSLAMGGAAYVEPYSEVQQAQQERHQEKRSPFPVEEREAAENTEVSHESTPKTPDLRQVAAELEQISLAFDRRLKFVIDQDSKEILIKVIDNETDTVIKELPPEELRRLHDRISETIGFLLDRMA